MKSIVIIGTGLAGYMLAKEFRKLNQTDRLILVTRDDGCFYSKPLLSTALTQQKTPDQLCVNDVNTMRSQLSATIHTGWEVKRIHAKKKQLICEDDQQKAQVLSYDQLVLANGAKKQSVPLKGDAVCKVLSVNNLEDYRCFYQQLMSKEPQAQARGCYARSSHFQADADLNCGMRSHGKKRVAIFGVGLVGCEFANDLLNTGHSVTMIAPDRYPLMTLTPEPVGQSLKKVFSEKGVDWHLSCFAESVNSVDDALQIQLSDDVMVIADLVLSATGISPDVQLAKTAGLSVNRGIVVNQQLQTSDASIFALGDCAEVAGTLKMYVAPILHAAKTLADILTGNAVTLQYPVMPIVIKTTNYPVVVVPPAVQQGEWEYDISGIAVKALFKDVTGKLQGFALSGEFVKDKMNCVKAIGAV